MKTTELLPYLPLFIGLHFYFDYFKVIFYWTFNEHIFRDCNQMESDSRKPTFYAIVKIGEIPWNEIDANSLLKHDQDGQQRHSSRFITWWIASIALKQWLGRSITLKWSPTTRDGTEKLSQTALNLQ